MNKRRSVAQEDLTAWQSTQDEILADELACAQIRLAEGYAVRYALAPGRLLLCQSERDVRLAQRRYRSG